MAYSNKVLDHYTNPRNVGTLDKNSTDVGTGLVGAPECGDVMRLQIKVNPETHVIEDAPIGNPDPEGGVQVTGVGPSTASTAVGSS